jgi:hypothetical protein
VVVFVRGIDTINQARPEEIKSAPPGFLAPWSSRALQARGPTAGLLCHGLEALTAERAFLLEVLANGHQLR